MPEARPSTVHEGPVLIAGAGIAGLALGIALGARGIRCRILERRHRLSEAGAGIQIGPNGTRVLERLGVAEGLRPHAGAPAGIRVRDGSSGRQLADLPLGAWIAARHGAPYWTAHRADLQAALAARARALPAIELSLGCEMADLTELGDGVRARLADGSAAEGTMLVGADGLWSRARQLLWPEHAPTYAGKMAVRTVVPAAAAGPRPLDRTEIWLGRDAHVLSYPVRGSAELALVAIVDEPTPREGWSSSVPGAQIAGRLAHFAPPLRALVGEGRDWRAWSLYDPKPLPRATRGRVVLIGDAGHPILPFLAQGGVMALEDAETLAAAIAAWPSDLRRALAAFERTRRGRVIRTQAASRMNGRIYHLAGPLAAARDLALAVLPGERIIAGYDWLYGWQGDRLEGGAGPA